jgi:hypothetical protein
VLGGTDVIKCNDQVIEQQDLSHSFGIPNFSNSINVKSFAHAIQNGGIAESKKSLPDVRESPAGIFREIGYTVSFFFSARLRSL